MERLTETYINKRKENQLSCLTPRQKEVLGLMAQGFSNKTIAGKLVIYERSVENYVNRIFSRIGISSGDPEVDARVKSVLLFQRNTPYFKNSVEEYCRIFPLSPKQKDLVDLIGDGYSNSAIARQVNISSKTVKNYIHIVLDEKILFDRQTYSARVVIVLASQTMHAANSHSS